jgi:hypothetical protein
VWEASGRPGAHQPRGVGVGVRDSTVPAPPCRLWWVLRRLPDPGPFGDELSGQERIESHPDDVTE